MSYYIFVENGELDGCGQCRILNDDIQCIEVSEELYNAYVANPDCFVLSDGHPVLDQSLLHKKQQDELVKRYQDTIQEWMDAEAVKLGYDNLLTACTYMNTGVPKFDAEGDGFRQWRSAVWAKGYALIDEVLSGQREIPADDADVIALLPSLNIVYPEVTDGAESD